MSKKTVVSNNADMANRNKGTNGTNIANSKNTGNRGKQLNPNHKKG